MNNKWAVVGARGFVAPRHIQAIKDVGDELILTCDLQGRSDFSDFHKMIRSKRWNDVTHVAICTPNYLHYKMFSEIKDKIVLCEKPLVLDSSKPIGDNVFTVLQLRYHPAVVQLKENLKGKHSGSLLVRVKRDRSYWEGWKGQETESGGILFNLGIHYFDLLMYLFGDKYDVISSGYGERLAEGKIDFNGSVFEYLIEIRDDDKGQDRSLEIDGQIVELSKKDNLSFEGLHTKVYEELLKGNGIPASEALKSIRLVERLKHGY